MYFQRWEEDNYTVIVIFFISLPLLHARRALHYSFPASSALVFSTCQFFLQEKFSSFYFFIFLQFFLSLHLIHFQKNPLSYLSITYHLSIHLSIYSILYHTLSMMGVELSRCPLVPWVISETTCSTVPTDASLQCFAFPQYLLVRL